MNKLTVFYYAMLDESAVFRFLCFAKEHFECLPRNWQ